MLRTVAILAALLLAPLATSSPLAFTGHGLGTVEKNFAPSALLRCTTVEVRVELFRGEERWLPIVATTEYRPDGTPCNLSLLNGPYLFLFEPATISGDPENGIRVDLSDECGPRFHETGPLGANTPYRYVSVDECSEPIHKIFINATLAFEGFGLR